jgi:hypothetical protein
MTNVRNAPPSSRPKSFSTEDTEDDTRGHKNTKTRKIFVVFFVIRGLLFCVSAGRLHGEPFQYLQCLRGSTFSMSSAFSVDGVM